MSNRDKITVTVVYRGHWRKPGQHDYDIVKIAGAPTVDILPEDGPPGPVACRIGCLITESEAAGSASRVTLITCPIRARIDLPGLP